MKSKAIWEKIREQCFGRKCATKYRQLAVPDYMKISRIPVEATKNQIDAHTNSHTINIARYITPSICTLAPVNVLTVTFLVIT